MTIYDPDNLLEGATLVTIFLGDLHNCRQRIEVLEQHEIPGIITGNFDGPVRDLGAPILALQVRQEDAARVVKIFEEIWEEDLDVEGLQQKAPPIVDLSQDVITCPGCQTQITEVTVDGECPECGLYLGLPEEKV